MLTYCTRRTLRTLTVATCLAGLSTFAAAGETLLDAKLAIGAGDFKRALEILQPMAEAGNGNAQYEIGVMYSTGEGVQQDIPTAIAWYKKAAEKGNADAQYYLGHEYSLRDLVNGVELFPEDYVEAYFWFSVAAANYTKHGKGNITGSQEMREITAKRISDADRAAVDARVKEWQSSH